MHIKPRCNHCLRERFMNVNMQPLLELFVIYVLLWKKFNFAYEASRSFFISTLSMKKKKSETLSRPDIGNSTRNRTMSGLQFFCFAWNFSNYEKSFIRALSIFLLNFSFTKYCRATLAESAINYPFLNLCPLQAAACTDLVCSKRNVISR